MGPHHAGRSRRVFCFHPRRQGSEPDLLQGLLRLPDERRVPRTRPGRGRLPGAGGEAGGRIWEEEGRFPEALRVRLRAHSRFRGQVPGLQRPQGEGVHREARVRRLRPPCLRPRGAAVGSVSRLPRLRSIGEGCRRFRSLRRRGGADQGPRQGAPLRGRRRRGRRYLLQDVGDGPPREGPREARSRGIRDYRRGQDIRLRHGTGGCALC